MQVQNISLAEALRSTRSDSIEGTVDIIVRIQDPDTEFKSLTLYPGSVEYRFQFWDDDNPPDAAMRDIASVIEKAHNNNHNLLVHCHAGKSRSGAVAQAAVAMFGAKFKGSLVSQNSVMKSAILRHLGYYGQYES